MTGNPATERKVLTTDHVCTLSSTEIGYRAVCTCGWKGSERDRMSDDYAWSNARDDVKSHERTHKGNPLQIRRFRVIAEIRYHREVGVFEAATPEEAINKAEESHAWSRISDGNRGGIYDAKAEAEELP